MKTHGATRARVAGAVFVVAIVVIGVSYFLTSPGRVGPTTETRTSTTSGLMSSQVSSQVSTQTSTQRSSQSLTSSSSSTTLISSSSSSSTSSLTSSSATTSSISSRSSTSASQKISHVIVVLMENEEYGNVIGNVSAPYQNGLLSTYALAGNYFGVAHPSLPNYLALIGGSTFGVASDCLPAQCSLPANTTSLASLFDSHNLSWKGYMESMPTNCSQVNSPDGLYFPKHNPFVYFGAITGNVGSGATSSYCDSHVVSMDQFYLDLQSGKLPNYSFIAPNICNDAHSCPLSTGDHWLSILVPKIIGSGSFASTALFVVYDEGDPADVSGGGGHVPCILVSPFAKAGYVSQVGYSHYSLAATVETLFGVGTLGRDDSAAAPMSDLFSPQAGLSR